MITSDKLAEKQWYIATTYSGYEQKVAEYIRSRIVTMNLDQYIFRIVVAEEPVPVFNDDGSPKMVKNKETGEMEQKVKIVNLYPGYVFVEMIMTDESWFMVRNTPQVTGIIGSSGRGQKPTPVGAQEMEEVLKRVGIVDEAMFDKYHVGDLVEIIRGTFQNTEGRIKSIDKENNTVKIDTIFFGRTTEIEVEFSEIVRK